jgi:hypothetical protein
MPSLMLIILYIFLLFAFYINFTKDQSASYLKKADWIVLFASPAALVYAFKYFILG